MASQQEKDSKYNPGIIPYHEVGPLAPLSDRESMVKIIDSVSERLLPAIVNPSERATTLLRGIANPSLYIDEVQDPVIAEDIMSAYRDLGDSTEAQGRDATARLFYEATFVVAHSKSEGLSSTDMLALNEARNWLNARGYKRHNADGKEVGYATTEPRIRLFEKVLAERRVRDGGMKDGQAFEIALMSVLEYRHYEADTEGVENNVRMARTREDKPARGMNPAIGTRVAHDVVYVRDGQTYRVQAKFGAGAGESARDKYDPRFIVELTEEDMTSQDLDGVFLSLIDAYKGVPSASEAILALADKYGSKITKSRHYQASKIVALANN